MAELWNDFTEQLGSLAGKWTAYAALGSSLLYLLGYLTLRFQLSTYGVATNLDIFDEKYLFAAAALWCTWSRPCPTSWLSFWCWLLSAMCRTGWCQSPSKIA